jgi:hypothetical protein
MRFYLRFFSLLLSLTALFLLFFVVFLLNNLIPRWIELGQKALENHTQTSLHYEDVQVDLLRSSITFKNIVFQGKNEEARASSVHLDFRIPDFQTHSIIIRKLLLEKPEFLITRAENKLKLFPDFFRSRTSSSTRWKWRIETLVLNHSKIHFHDTHFPDSAKLIIRSKQLRIHQNFDTYTFHMKGPLYFPKYPKAKLALDFKGERRSLNQNFDLLLYGTGLDLSFLSPYQHPFSKLQLTHGTMNMRTDIHCRMGILNGYSHLTLKHLKLNGFNDGIFSTALGLSSASFVTMLKKSHNTLELDFYVKGTKEHPEFKLGETTKRFILTAPIAITKESLNLAENIINIALLGLPRKLINIIHPPSDEEKEEEKK